MNNWTVENIIAKHNLNQNLYNEFLHIQSMSVGIYKLGKGTKDPQQPHSEDELYYVVEGSAQLTVGEDDISVKSGSLVFVKAHQQHSFHSILEDLIVLVFFAPAEYSNR